MNLTDTYTLKFQKGSPVFLDDICAIFPAKMGEVVDLGYDLFQDYLGIITFTKPATNKKESPEIQKLLDELTDFQYLLLLVSSDKSLNEKLKGAFNFFCKENEVIFSLQLEQIIIGPLEEQHILTEEKFYELQKIIRRMYFLEQADEEIIINPDDTAAVKRLKMQMRANREKIRRAKMKEAAKNKSDLKFSDLIGSITINNCGLNMENIWNITYYAFHDQLKRMGWRDQFNINNQAVLAGAKIDKAQLRHWMRSIASSENN